MTYKLFIDDERNPVTDDWVVARNSTAAFMYIGEYGFPNEIAFDHDLGGEDTSIVFLKMLKHYMLDYKLTLPEDFNYSVHSQNPIGAKNIYDFMEFDIYAVDEMNKLEKLADGNKY